MYELIWVGNTLYPRWLVFLVVGVAVVALVSLLTFISIKIEKVTK